MCQFACINNYQDCSRRNKHRDVQYEACGQAHLSELEEKYFDGRAAIQQGKVTLSRPIGGSAAKTFPRTPTSESLLAGYQYVPHYEFYP